MASLCVLSDEAMLDALDRPLVDLGLDLRTVNSLELSGVFLVRDLLNCCGKRFPCDRHACPTLRCSKVLRLFDVSNVGDKTFGRVMAALEDAGFFRSPQHYTAWRRCHGKKAKPGLPAPEDCEAAA